MGFTRSSKGGSRKLPMPHTYTTELINSIEITIAIDIFGTIANAIVNRISLLLLLLLIRSSISIDFLSCLKYAVSVAID